MALTEQIVPISEWLYNLKQICAHRKTTRNPYYNKQHAETTISACLLFPCMKHERRHLALKLVDGQNGIDPGAKPRRIPHAPHIADHMPAH